MKAGTSSPILQIAVLLIAVLVLPPACSDNGTFVTRLLEADQLGSKKACWDQRNFRGRLVDPGKYDVHLKAGSFTQTKTLNIGTNPNRPRPASCAPDSGRMVLPTEYSLWGFPDPFLVGDTIVVRYDIPITTHVTIDIFRQ